MQIEFSKAFSKAPRVFVSILMLGSVGNVFASAYDVSKLGFSLVFKRTAGEASSFTVQWVAIE